MIDPDFLFGSNTVIRKSAFAQAGPYNEKYKSNFEDVDISDRLKAKGFHLVYEPRALSQHMKRDTVISVLRMDWRWWIYFYQDKDKYDSLSNVLRCNFKKSLSYLKADLREGRFPLALVDLFQFFALNYYDLRHRLAIKEMIRG